ncbi:MAG: hypothetical protein EOP04_02320 [Proteobacteria bacterium]|nr:MAG: hypothetical protein EOP04_02320 [Pseudomonadota bacterium]
MITRKDITEHRLEHHWFSEGDRMQKFINVDPMDPGLLPSESIGLLRSADNSGSSNTNSDIPPGSDPDLTMNPLTSPNLPSTFAFELAPPSLDGTPGTYVAPPPITGPPSNRARESRAYKEPKNIRK